MPAISVISLVGSNANTRSFSPVGIDSAGVARFADRSGGIAIGFPVISIMLRNPTKGSRNYRITGKIVIPTLEVTAPSTATGIQPAPTKAYDILGTFEFVIPERSTSVERAEALALARSYFADAVVTSAVTDLESVY